MKVELNHTLVHAKDPWAAARDVDAIWGRLRDSGRQWWADPHKRHPGEINHEDGGRGLYWEGPEGHFLEIITRPYGSGGS